MMHVTKHEWSPNVPALLRGACGGFEETIKYQIENGDAHLYHLESVNTDLWAVIRFEAFAESKEMVIVCVGGRGIKEAGEFFIREAERLGMTDIRYHVQNPVVQRLYKMRGVFGEEFERVYKKKIGVNNG